MWKQIVTRITKPSNFAGRRAKRLRPDERGLASAELMVVMPVFVLLIVSLLWFAGLAYYHLALLTTANDCAVMIAHAPGQYWNAAELVRGAYGINAYVAGHAESGLNVVACSAAASWEPIHVLRYTIHMPSQPYRSLWP